MTSSREAELTRAEGELSQLESRLAEQVSRAATEAAALAGRLEQVRASLARAVSEPGASPELGEQAARLQGLPVPGLSVDQARERALEAREAALDERRQAGLEVQAALRLHQERSAALGREVAEAEAALKRQSDAMAQRARAQQEAAAAKARQAEITRAAAAVQAQGQKVPGARVPGLKPATPPEGKEARRNGRVRMHTSIDMRSDSNFFTGFSMDISEGGVFIATVDTLPQGTQVELDFTLPGGKPMKVPGVVRWVREASDKHPELMPGVGVQFTGLPADVASVISSFVTTRDPLFYPD